MAHINTYIMVRFLKREPRRRREFHHKGQGENDALNCEASQQRHLCARSRTLNLIS